MEGETGVTDTNKLGFSVPRIVEVLLAAGLVGAITLYANNEINSTKIAQLAEATGENAERIDLMADRNAVQIDNIKTILSDIRVEFAKRNRLELEIEALRQQMHASHNGQAERIENLEHHQNTIWPRLREMKERLQALEPKDAGRWQY